MADLSDDRRDRIHALLQELGPTTDDAGSLLTGWAIVLTWVNPSGEHVISRAHAAEIPAWIADGLHHYALYGDWRESA